MRDKAGHEGTTTRSREGFSLRAFVSSWLPVVLTLALSCALGLTSVHAETIDRVLAVVAGNLITLSDVNAAYELGLVRPPAPVADPVRYVLTQLIDRELQLNEVDRFAPPEPSAEAVDQAVAELQRRFASAQALDAVLSRSGIDIQHLRETLRENLRIQAYLDQRFASAGDRRQELVDDWIAGLRRRSEVLDLYVPVR